MVTESQKRYHEYLETDYWKQVQFKVKERAGFRCQTCNSQLDLVAHHRTYENRGRELEHLNDLVCLCKRCHASIHSIIEPAQGQQQPAQILKEVVVERVKLSKKQKRRVREAEVQRLMEQVAAQPVKVLIQDPAKIGTTKPLLLKKPKVIAHSEEDIERDMPPGDSPTVTLTKELIDRLRTSGTFCNAALVPLGLIKSDIMIAGWPERLVGKVISRTAYKMALAGRYYYGARMPVSRDELPVDFR